MEKCPRLNLPKLCIVVVYDVSIKSLNGQKTQKPKFEGVKRRQSLPFTAEFSGVNASSRILFSRYWISRLPIRLASVRNLRRHVSLQVSVRVHACVYVCVSVFVCVGVCKCKKPNSLLFLAFISYINSCYKRPSLVDAISSFEMQSALYVCQNIYFSDIISKIQNN